MSGYHLCRLAAAMALLCIGAGAQGQTLTPNTKYFSVSDYYVPDANADYHEYRAHGFYEPGGPSVTPRLTMLPLMRLNMSSAKFFDENGTAFDPRLYPNRKAGLISVSARYSTGMPTKPQLAGIGATLSGISLPNFILDTSKSGTQPLIYPPASTQPPLVQAIYAGYSQADDASAAQRTLAAQWGSYVPNLVPLNELALSLVVGGTTLASQSYSGSTVVMNGWLPQLYIYEPSQSIKNLIANGDYEMAVSYRFVDSSTSFIDARIDAKQVINTYLKETREAITRNKSSGFAVFGLGYRRSKLKTSISQSMDSNLTNSSVASTRIVMNDADDSMIEQFEEAFFPEAQVSEVISNHFAAAEEAGKQGNTQLQQAHLEYAKSLQQQDKLKEVDAVAAAAALAAGNYAMFVAQGVRAQISNDSNEQKFRRVITNSADIEKRVEWSMVKRYSVQRQINTILRPESPAKQTAAWGICGGVMMDYTVPGQPSYTPFGIQPTSLPKQGLLVTCTYQGAAAHSAGLTAGMLIDRIGGQPITKIQDYYDALAYSEPGQDIDIRVLDGTKSDIGGVYKTLSLRPRLGAPVKTEVQ